MAGEEEIRERLLALAQNVNWDELYVVCDEIEHRTDGQNFVPDLLAILEANPDFDFGTVGPITHSVEKFYRKGYEHDLIASIRWVPTFYTVSMVKWLINGTSGEEQNFYVSLLQEIADNEKVTPDLRELARYNIGD